ncbi:hypothetical protein [Shouchella miscanthi]|uniref:hypothetical protein n=1 Tax=Shouchella miscanthi TaxID=2598861 RepID=UPI0011A013C9|nr:hypothetical protein [Shouchella miscanthi]
MKPPMRDDVVVMTTQLDENGNPITDNRGRPIAPKETPTKARITNKVRVVRNRQGVEEKTSIEFDLPPDVEFGFDSTISYTDTFGQERKAQVVNWEESTNLSGSKVYFRTVYGG